MFGENSPSKKFHRERVLHYIVDEGMLEVDAIEHADQDLKQWNNPLPLPVPAGDVDYFEV